MRKDGLTEQEGVVSDALVKAWNAYVDLPTQHPQEQWEFGGAINLLQSLLAIRVARREFPEGWPHV